MPDTDTTMTPEERIKAILTGQAAEDEGESVENPDQEPEPLETKATGEEEDTDDVQPEEAEEDAEEAAGQADEVGDRLTTLAEALGVPEERLVFDEATGKVKLRVPQDDGTELLIDPGQALKAATEGEEEEAEDATAEEAGGEIMQPDEMEAEAQRLAQAAQLIQHAQQRLIEEREAAEKLKESDPQKYAEALAAVQQKELELQQLATLAQQQAREYQVRYQQTMEQRLVKAIPEWSDPIVRQREAAELIAWARKQGVADQQLAAIQDPLLLAMMRDAMRYREAEKKVKQAKKAPTKKAPVLKTKRPAGPQSKKAKAEKELRQRLRKSGRLEDAAELLKGRII